MRRTAIDPSIGDHLIPEDADLDELIYAGGNVVERDDETRVFLSGIVSDEPLADIKGQAEMIFEKIERYLEEAGGTTDDIVRLEIFFEEPHLTDEHLLALHAVRREFFDPPYPASTVVEVRGLVRDDRYLEAQADAVIPGDDGD
jgi:enamine deaminase RidA (YjgF/YER057c/UK114 family)